LLFFNKKLGNYSDIQQDVVVYEAKAMRWRTRPMYEMEATQKAQQTIFNCTAIID